MHTLTLEKGLATFLNGLHGKNRSTATIRAYQTDISQFISFLHATNVSIRGMCRVRVYAMHGIYTFISSTGLCQVITSNSPLRLKKSALHV
jgi:hypothetical protein